jgi:hypothetical protein
LGAASALPVVKIMPAKRTAVKKFTVRKVLTAVIIIGVPPSVCFIDFFAKPPRLKTWLQTSAYVLLIINCHLPPIIIWSVTTAMLIRGDLAIQEQGAMGVPVKNLKENTKGCSFA